jgi:hypothetical protein
VEPVKIGKSQGKGKKIHHLLLSIAVKQESVDKIKKETAELKIFHIKRQSSYLYIPTHFSIHYQIYTTEVLFYCKRWEQILLS